MPSRNGLGRSLGRLIVTPDMAAVVVPSAALWLGTQFSPRLQDASTPVLIGLAAAGGAIAATAVNQFRERRLRRHYEGAAELQHQEANSHFALAGDALLGSLSAIHAEVGSAGPKPSAKEVQRVMERVVELASRALTTCCGGSEIVVCAKLLINRDGVAWARRVAIWPSFEGGAEFLVASSAPLHHLTSMQMQYYYTQDSEDAQRFYSHAEFPARTILVTPMEIAPREGVGFLWFSSAAPGAFMRDPALAYARHVSKIVAPLFVTHHTASSTLQADERATAGSRG